jgi:hypothetical protein
MTGLILLCLVWLFRIMAAVSIVLTLGLVYVLIRSFSVDRIHVIYYKKAR